MRCFLYLSAVCPILLLAGCEDSEGTQIGNEGIVATDPHETGCAARALAGNNTFEGWPATLDDATDLLISNLADVQLAADGVITPGTVDPTVVSYRLEEGDCDNVYIEIDVQVRFDDQLEARASGDLLLSIDQPSDGAKGALAAATWSGALLPAPGPTRMLYLDASLTTAVATVEVVLETCESAEDCVEETYGTIEPAE